MNGLLQEKAGRTRGNLEVKAIMRPAPVALHFFDRPNSIDAATSFLCPISSLYASRFISRCKKCVVAAAYLWRLPHKA